jgi:hypothetical protein
MGIYYDNGYYGIKFCNNNNEELYKIIYNEKMNKEQMKYAKQKFIELKKQYGKVIIFVNIYCTYTYDFPSTTELVWLCVGVKDVFIKSLYYLKK